MPIPTSKPFEKQTAKDRAYQQIKDWIIDGTLTPGEKLAEVDLANSISVSRTPIREALLKLDQDGFVIMAAGRITKVSPLEDEDIDSLFEPMAVIEGLAANQAAANMTEDGLRTLAKLEKKYRVSLSSGNIKTVLKADRAFHEAILEIADNAYEKNFSELLYGHIIRYEMHFLDSGQKEIPELKNLKSHHDVLLKALAEQNSTKASTSMTKDWLTTLRVIKASQEKEKED
jgi:DNA-binding GntR family transcriptional regulator